MGNEQSSMPLRCYEEPISEAGYGRNINDAIDSVVDSILFMGYSIQEPPQIRTVRFKEVKKTLDIHFIYVKEFGWCVLRIKDINGRYRATFHRFNIYDWLEILKRIKEDTGDNNVSVKTIFININNTKGNK